jgi:choline dehydrogenase-like flavoprotein
MKFFVAGSGLTGAVIARALADAGRDALRFDKGLNRAGHGRNPPRMVL